MNLNTMGISKWNICNPQKKESHYLKRITVHAIIISNWWSENILQWLRIMTDRYICNETAPNSLVYEQKKIFSNKLFYSSHIPYPFVSIYYTVTFHSTQTYKYFMKTVCHNDTLIFFHIHPLPHEKLPSVCREPGWGSFIGTFRRKRERIFGLLFLGPRGHSKLSMGAN